MEKTKDPVKVKRGKRSKAQGATFELRVRKDLEEKGWIIDKWSNQVEFGNTDTIDGRFQAVKWKDLTLKNGQHYPGPVARLIPAKRKWAGPGRPMVLGSGFPDFLCFKRSGELDQHVYEVIGVESKMAGTLDKEEKEKCRWLLNNNIFSKILIARKEKVKNRVVVVYEDFVERYSRFINKANCEVEDGR